MLWLIAQYVLKAVIRDRLPLIFLLSIILCLCFSVFFGSTAITEQNQFALIFMANALRFVSVCFIILYICFYFSRTFETRDIEGVLTRPVSRLQYLAGHYLAFQGLVFAFIFFLFILFLFLIKTPEGQGALWLAGLFFELSLVAVIALFFGLLMPYGIAPILLSFGFYILGRLSGGLLAIAESPTDPSIFTVISANVMGIISIIIPRFDLMVQSDWLIYDASVSLSQGGIILIQYLVFTGLILSAAYYDLVRKQF